MKKDNKLIGLSLSSCVREIVEGYVKLSDVHFIISGTNFSSVDSIMENNIEIYWNGIEAACREVVEKLWNANMIFQPRSICLPAPNICNTKWLVGWNDSYPVGNDTVYLTGNYSISLPEKTFVDYEGNEFTKAAFPMAALTAFYKR